MVKALESTLSPRALHRAAFVLLVLVAPCLAQTFLLQPKVTNISHSSARVTFIVSATPTNAEVQWGPSFANTTSVRIDGAAPITGTAVLAGLTPSTTYNVRARLNTGAIVSSTVQFTTAAEPNPHPVKPAEPVSTPDVSMPPAPPNTNEFNPSTNPFGRRITIASDCSDFATKLGWLSSSLPATSETFEMVLPAGTTCEGQFTFPARANHTGWFIVRSSAVGTQAFPPEGVRWTPDWSPDTSLATLQTNIYPLAINWLASSYWINATDCYQDGENGQIGISVATPFELNMLPVLECRTTWPAYSGPTSITNITGPAPYTVTAPGHQLQNGMTIKLSNNGLLKTTLGYLVFNVSGNTFQITPNGYNGAGAVFNAGLNPTFTVIQPFRWMPHTEGATDPSGSCTVGDVYWNKSTSKLYWCRQDGWQNYKIVFTQAGAAASPALMVAANAARYRFMGLRVALKEMPPWPTGWLTAMPSGDCGQGSIQSLVNIEQGTSNIVFDRVYVQGRDYPYRISYLMIGMFKDSAVINSYIGPAAWFKSAGYHETQQSFGILPRANSQNMLFHNNYVSVAGLSFFVNEEAGWSSGMQSDFTITRNTFELFPRWRRGDPANNGVNYNHRNTIEFKHGERILVEGNQFKYGWSAGKTYGTFVLASPRLGGTTATTVNIASFKAGAITTVSDHKLRPGAVVLITGTGSDHDGLWEVESTPDCPSPCTKFTIVGNPTASGTGGSAMMRVTHKMVRDFTVRNNFFYQGTEAFRITGHDSVATQWQTAGQRFEFTNNLVVDLDIRSFSAGGRVDQFGISQNGNYGAMTVYNIGPTEDVTISNNTIFGQRGNMVSMIGTDPRSEGLRADNNLYTWDGTGAFTALRGNGQYGEAGLNQTYTRDGVPAWLFRNNVICCGLASNSGTYPSTTRWPSNINAVKWMAPSLTAPFDFRLRHDSPYVSGASQRGYNDRNAGADIDLLEEKLGLVKNARVHSITRTSAQLSYTAPRGEACTVEYGPSDTFGTGTRIADGGGDGLRTVSLTGLEMATNYNYRILCATEQPTGIFRTE